MISSYILKLGRIILRHIYEVLGFKTQIWIERNFILGPHDHQSGHVVTRKISKLLRNGLNP